MKINDMINKFEEFLKKEGVLEEFIDAAEQQNAAGDIDDWLDRQVNANFIDNAMVWAQTSEGHTFWEELNNKWHDECIDVFDSLVA